MHTNNLIDNLDNNNCMLAAKIFKRDVQITFASIGRTPFSRGHTRSKIIEFSKRSVRRLRHTIRNSDELLKTFITLTYPADISCDGKKTKTYLNAFLQYLQRKRLKHVWVLEFQLLGAPYYHIIATRYIDKDELSERWYKIVGSGDEKHLKSGTQINYIRSKNQLYGYLSNYIKNLEQKIIPVGFENLGRFWGVSQIFWYS